MEYVLHLRERPFQSIKNKTKTIEMRLFDEKRQQYQVGDILIFEHNDTLERIYTKIIALHRYNHFEDLYNKFDKVSLGYNEDETASASDMLDYYPIEEQNKFGVLGIEIKVLE